MNKLTLQTKDDNSDLMSVVNAEQDQVAYLLTHLLKLSGALELWWLSILPCSALLFVAPQFEDLCVMLDYLHN